MKRLKRGLMLAAGLALVTVSVVGVQTLGRALSGTAERDLSQLTTSRGYWLDASDVLTFSLEAGRTKFRLFANAALNAEHVPVGPDAHYSLSYRVLGARGQELRAANYYLRLHSSLPGNQPKRSFLARSATPSDTNLFYLDLAQDAGADTLELRVGPSSLPLAGVAVRPYYQEAQPAERLDRIWERLHESKHEQLALPNVLGVEFLTDLEERSLVSTFWHPAVPRGIEGSDFDVALLIDEPVPPGAQGPGPAPDRWFLPAGRSASFGVPAATELLVSAGDASGRARPGDLKVFWSGRLRHERAELALESSGPGLKSATRIDRGMVTFQAEKELWLETADSLQRKALRPQSNTVRAYNAAATPLRIPVRHLPGQPTPVRLDLRVPAEVAQSRLKVSFARGDHVVSSREIDVQQEPSRRDWLVLGGRQVRISNRERVYLNVPADISELRLASEAELWVSAYNRPPGLTQSVRIPEALFGGTEETRLHPRWFVLPPANSPMLMTSGSSALIRVGLKPPDPAGQTPTPAFSQRLYPQQRWSGIRVLTRNDPRRAIHPSARGNTFQPLVRGERAIRLRSAPGMETVEPTLLVKQAGGESGRLTIEADGRPLVDREITASSGRIELPPVRAGSQRWRVDAPESMTLYLSDLELRSPSFREQNLQEVNGSALRYQLQRSGNGREVLSFRIFSSVPGRVLVRVTLDAWQRDAGPGSDWTLESAEYDLLLEETNRASALADGVGALSYEALAFHPIGLDLPSGVHHLTVEVVGPSPAALSEDAVLLLGVTRSGDGSGDGPMLRIRRFEVSSR